MKLLFKPDQPPATTRRQPFYRVNVALAVIFSDSDAQRESIRILTTLDGHLPSTPLLTSLESAIGEIITSYTGHGRRSELIGRAISQLREDIANLQATGMMFGRPEDKSHQAILLAKMAEKEAVIRKLESAKDNDADIDHLIPDRIESEVTLYTPSDGFPVILSEARLKDDQLVLVFASGAAILAGRKPKEELATWRVYEPVDEEGSDGTSARQIHDAVRAFISPIGNKGARIEEGLMRAFTLSADPHFKPEPMKRSIELLSGDAISTVSSLFRKPDLDRWSQDCKPGDYLKPLVKEMRQPHREDREQIRMPVIDRILIKYSKIPDLRVAIAKHQPRQTGPVVDGSDESSEAGRLFDLALTDPDARQIIDVLISAEDPDPALDPGRNIMTLQWRKREKEFFLRSFAEKGSLESGLKMITGEATAEQDPISAEKTKARSERLAGQGFQRLWRDGACDVWLKDLSVSARSTEPLNTELFVTTGTGKAPGIEPAAREAAVRETAKILHTIAKLSRDAYEYEAGQRGW